MADIRVEKKKSKAFPWWLLAVAALAIVGLVLLLDRSSRNITAPSAERAMTAAPAVGSGATTSAKTCGDDNGCAAKELCLDSACKPIDAATSVCSAASTHFATDSAEIDGAQKNALDRVARCLRADRTMTLSIEGNADQRGSADHNEELATKRARAVARELTARGISAAQLNVVSYGDNHLLCAENDDACWTKNRRTEMQLKK